MGIVRSEGPLSIVWHGAVGMNELKPLPGNPETKAARGSANGFVVAAKRLAVLGTNQPAPGMSRRRTVGYKKPALSHGGPRAMIPRWGSKLVVT